MVSIKINSWYKEKNGRFYSSKTKGYNLGDSLSESSENWTEKAKGEVSIYVILAKEDSQWSTRFSRRLLQAVRNRYPNGLVVSKIQEGRHPTPVLLPGKCHGQRSLVGCSPWGRWGSDTIEWLLSLFALVHWRRKWQPTPVFLPGESQGRWSLVGCRLWGRTESDTTEAT